MPTKLTAPSEDTVRTRAYLLWEADGSPLGQDAHYWHLAHTELSPPKASRRAAATAAPEKKAGSARKTAAKPAEKAAKPKKQ
jgi:hypothetical protein